MNVSRLYKLIDKLTLKTVTKVSTYFGANGKRKSLKDEIDLNKKIVDFYNQYRNDFSHNVEFMDNFVNKMAVWYELRYTDDVVNNLIRYKYESYDSVNDVMFRKNNYLTQKQEDVGQFDVLNKLNWVDFYNRDVFEKSLGIEGFFLKKAKFKNFVYLSDETFEKSPYFEFDEDGVCLKSFYINHQCSIDPFVGMTASEVLLFMKNREMEIPENNGIERAILEYTNELNMKREVLNCVMYKLMLRGGNRVGSRRALLFAKEFNLDIDIPVKYGIDTSDPYLLDFLFSYIRFGGRVDLNCYVNCKIKLENDSEVDVCSVSQLFSWVINEAVRYGDFQTLNYVFSKNKDSINLVDELYNRKPKKKVLVSNEKIN